MNHNLQPCSIKGCDEAGTHQVTHGNEDTGRCIVTFMCLAHIQALSDRLSQQGWDFTGEDDDA